MRLRSLSLLSLLVAAVACAGMRQRGAESADAATTLSVDNQGFADMTIYASRSGQRVRLGTAPGHARSNFTVPAALISGITTLRFVADPIGSSRASISEEINVSPGDSLELIIPPG